MVDFKKLRESKAQANVINPIDIFERTPKPPNISGLYGSQTQVLEEWFKRRNERDLVIKLPTGGGKTLVGLLIAKSLLNEHHEPVIYLASTNQLVEQALTKAQEYRIPAVVYQKNVDLPDDFVAGRSVLICTYNAIFNGLSKFGVSGSSKEIIKATAIILDDAHVAFSTVRDSFTLSIDRKNYSNEYEYLTNLFRVDFQELGRVGTFDDIVSGKERNSILEIPYWNWQVKSNQVRDYLRSKQDNFLFAWPFIRDAFDYCHCLISSRAFVITPIFPLVDMIPTFADCPRRIFMSATISDDSAIVRTFDAQQGSIAEPITSDSLAGVSERMILVPEWMQFSKKDDIPKTLRGLAKSIAEDNNVGTVILVPSDSSAQAWKDDAELANSSPKVTELVKKLQDGELRGPVTFANRYDGMDFPGSACRLLILSGLPRGSSEYDSYLASVFVGGFAFNSTVAQRIEQGMGRGARGSNDYCVVIITGKDLISWLSRSANLKFLTSSTFAQFRMGEETSKSITDEKEFRETIMLCLNRDKDWMEYHAERLADLAETAQAHHTSLSHADVERKAFKLLRDGYFEKAIAKLEKTCQQEEEMEKKSRGWLKQFSARIAHYWGKFDLAQELQQYAYADNSTLLRPKTTLPYIQLTLPGQQANAIVSQLIEFNPRRGYATHFDQVVSQLVPEASSNQFEQALADLGSILGFCTQRPDNLYSKGPDVLWLLDDQRALVIEAKSRKQQDNTLTKDQHGQLLNAGAWFKKNYPNFSSGILVSVHPNTTTTPATETVDSKALTFEKLNELITDTRRLLSELCEAVISDNELIIRCEQLLSNSTLKPKSLIEQYLVPFDK
ncbi:MAG: DEAD/DEAH box helicase family protein [Coleofasciculus sp. G3-WIS-01]|uniref:DEAD/DEAH box helicase family protein n=1 Tax=Coleofasciculus sp. G3-WIS-01 TaxID=3069528 RepID=UPI0032F9D626